MIGPAMIKSRVTYLSVERVELTSKICTIEIKAKNSNLPVYTINDITKLKIAAPCTVLFDNEPEKGYIKFSVQSGKLEVATQDITYHLFGDNFNMKITGNISNIGKFIDQPELFSNIYMKIE